MTETPSSSRQRTIACAPVIIVLTPNPSLIILIIITIAPGKNKPFWGKKQYIYAPWEKILIYLKIVVDTPRRLT
jgi:hypothetical protein